MFADIILIIHFLIVGFNIGGLVIVWIGTLLRWTWIRNFWFRIIHLAAMSIVAIEAIFGITCPLTDWEHQMRVQNVGGFEGSFMQYWIHKIIFYSAPEYIFTIIYISFTIIVIATFLFIPPRWPRKKDFIDLYQYKK
jgi:hypothetical protein